MKRLFRLLLILGLAAGTWSCADDGTPSVSINGGTDFLSLDHLARSGKITVNAPAPWSVTLAPENYGQDEKPDWLTLSAEEGPAGYSEIDVTFAENPGPARSASLLFSCDGKTSAFTVSQSAGGTGFDAPDYYFYISVGTMPTLYSGLHLLSHDKPSYVSYERASTFDAAEFPDRAFVYPVSDPTGHATNEELRAMSEAMKRRILEINAEDPTAVFGLWVDDLRCRLGYDWFVAQGIDFIIVRELIGGVYFGNHETHTLENGEKQAIDSMPYSEHEIERIGRIGFETAQKRRKKLCCVDKANVLDTSRLWRSVMHRLQAEYPDVEYSEMFVDNCAMQIVKNPAQFDVIVTENMFGDILSDEASMITGSIGMIPSSSLGDGTRGLYEPIHGSAPDIAGKDIVNPTACILSAAMMLRYSFGMAAEADAIENAVNRVLDKGLRTADNMSDGCTCLGCTAMGDAILAEL